MMLGVCPIARKLSAEYAVVSRRTQGEFPSPLRFDPREREDKGRDLLARNQARSSTVTRSVLPMVRSVASVPFRLPFSMSDK